MMKTRIALLLTAASLFSCVNTGTEHSRKPVEGTWKLISGTLIEKGNSTVTSYTKGVSFIKIINGTHFAFLQHDLKKGKDTGAVFVSGGGRYTIDGNNYTEHLEYCSARNWEGNDFNFTVTIKGDTLLQTGLEKIDSLGVNRVNTEKYVRMEK